MNQTELKKIYLFLKDLINKPENKIKPETETIGGLWTVDAFEFDGLKYNLHTEGYASDIFCSDFHISQIYRYDGDVFTFDGDHSALKKHLLKHGFTN